MRSNVTALAATLAALALPSLSAAQTFELFGSDGANSRHESPQNFAMELRFSPWQPMIDSEFSGSGGGPFLQYFGERDARGVRTAVRDRLLGALELDWQALRINPIGSLGLGASVGFSSFTANAPLTATPSRDSGQESTLAMVPMYAVAVLRLDVLARRTVVPLVFYGKAGVAASYWWITSGENLARRSAASPMAPTNNAGDFGQAASGLSYAWQLAAGAMLRLDWLEPRAQRAWDLEMGVNHSYLFAEYMIVRDWERPQLRFGSNTWAFGVAFEF
jgi:hypothetical protein